MLTAESTVSTLLDAITKRQRDVMELVLQHRTSKEIARDLGIAPNTVDQRINAVRDKLGARDRAEAARIYAQLIQTYGKTTYGPMVVDSAPTFPVTENQGEEIAPIFSLNDSAVAQPGDWGEIGRLVIPRTRFAESKLWRVAAIVGIAIGTIALGTLMLAVMNALNSLI